MSMELPCGVGHQDVSHSKLPLSPKGQPVLVLSIIVRSLPYNIKHIKATDLIWCYTDITEFNFTFF